MISVAHLTKTYAGQTLFADVSTTIGAKEKIGLIGRNGSGKSTFLKLLLDQESADGGTIEIPDRMVVRSLEQHLNFTEPTIVAQVCTGLPANEQHSAWKAESILLGLGFTTEDFIRKPAEFSSGMQIRLRLAEALVSPANLLLLDEPTNYLDIVSLRWLERFLQQWSEAFILVTHDQSFMEKVVGHTIGIHRGKMRKIQGGPQKLLTQIAKEESVHENTRVNQEKKAAKTKEFISKFRAGARSAGLVQSRIKSLAKQDIHEKLQKLPQISFNFLSKQFKGNLLLEATNICFKYLPDEPLIEKFSLRLQARQRIAIVGRNGQGKSTLLQLLTGQLQYSAGKIKQHVDLEVGFFAASEIETLNESNTILSELLTLPDVSEKQVRSVCASLLFTGNATKKYIAHLSGGEKSRVCFAKVLLKSAHLLVLDEPTNHLDMESCQALTHALQQFEGTVLLVTHNEKILSALADRLVVFDDNAIKVYEMGYDEFLQDVGWKEEAEEDVAQKPVTDTKTQYLEVKEQRKQLRQVQSRQAKLLKHIEELERKQVENATLLQKQYELSNREMMETLGREAKQLAGKISSAFEEIEDLLAKEQHIQYQLSAAGTE